ncbi:MAG: serine/threonine-protein kinase [Acidobacteriota bacterium]
MEESVSLRDVVEELKSGLTRHATGGRYEDDEYRRLRKILLGSSVASLVPDFIKKSRDVGDFWAFIQPLFPTYRERRSFINAQFDALLERVEAGALEQVANFEIGERIGRGGFGEVFRFHHRLLGMDFAVKLFAPIYGGVDTGHMDRFFREARILFALNHPNIIRVFDVGLYQDRPFIRMELFEGETLNDLLKARGRVSAKAARPIVGRIAEGLDHAHKKGVIHRDLKPSNVMIAKPKQLRILDFGLGVFIEDDIVSRVTKTGESVVGGYYTAPELLQDPKLLDPRVDIYSLGAIWFNLLTGRAPAGVDIAEALDAEVELGEDEREALLKCLRSTQKRHASAAELLESIHALTAG